MLHSQYSGREKRDKVTAEMDVSPGQEVVKEAKPVSLSRKMSKVGLLAAMKTFTKPHFQRKKKSKEGVKHQQSRSWDSGLCTLGVSSSRSGGVSSPGSGGATMGTIGSYKRIYWPGTATLYFWGQETKASQ